MENFEECEYGNKFVTIFVVKLRIENVMPEVFRMFGMRFFFFANEHLPIHIHVQNAEGRAKFQVSPKVKLLSNKGLKSSDIKLAEAVIEENEATLIKAWEVFHGKAE